MSHEEEEYGEENFIEGEDASLTEEALEGERVASRARRNTSKTQRKNVLEQYKSLRAGMDISSVLDARQDVDDLYDVVDEKEYQQRMHDDFVEDDGTGDYLDGGDLWDEDEDDYGGESSASRRKGRTGPVKRKDKLKGKARINPLFLGGSKGTRLGATVLRSSDEKGGLGEQDQFLAELLEEEKTMGMGEQGLPAVDPGIDYLMQRHKTKKTKRSAFNSALFSSNIDEQDDETFSSAPRKASRPLASTNARIQNAQLTLSPKKRPTQAPLSNDIPSSSSSSSRPAHRPKMASLDDKEEPSRDASEVQAEDFDMYAERGFGDFDFDNAPSLISDEHEKKMVDLDGDEGLENKAAATFFSPPFSSPKKKASAAVLDLPDDEELETRVKKGVSLLTASRTTVPAPDEWEKKKQTLVDTTAAPLPDLPSTSTTASSFRAKVTEVPYVYVEKPVSEGDQGDENEKEKVFRFFWIDAYEGDGPSAGTIYLFGKVFQPSTNTFISCCLVVHNNERNVFFLPRETRLSDPSCPVEMGDLYQEISDVMKTNRISTFLCKPVQRRYAFGIPGVPFENAYMKVKYSGALPRLSSDLSGDTFSHAFGTNVGCLERFIMKRKLMGPCWLEVKCPIEAGRELSWCKVELEVENPKYIRVLDKAPPSPPLTCLSLALQTVYNPSSRTNEILAVSGFVHEKIEMDMETGETALTCFTVVRKLDDAPYPIDFNSSVKANKMSSVRIESKESSLLSYLVTKIYTLDPDIIVGHNMLGYDLDVLLHRIKANNVPKWSRLGRLHRSVMPKPQNYGGRVGYMERTILSGRLLVDIKTSAREFIRLTNYELSELVSTQLKENREDIDASKLPAIYKSGQTLVSLLAHIERDAYLILQLMLSLQVLPLSKQITGVTGGLLCRTLAGGRAERNEYLLCHEFHKRKFIVPDKQWKSKDTKEKETAKGKKGKGKGKEKEKEKDHEPAHNDEEPIEDLHEEMDDEAHEEPAASSSLNASAKKGRRKPQYAGGLVLEPKRGFYDTCITLLDFNSLYPSIIQEYNICFTTVKLGEYVQSSEDEEFVLPEVDSTNTQSVLPAVLRRLVEMRRYAKKQMERETNPAKKMGFNIEQKALKLTANSLYGCLGFAGSRFYAKPLASLITYKGRQTLEATVKLAREQLNLDVIYGDTDSLMINTQTKDLAKAREVGEELKKKVNLQHKTLQIDVECVFKTLLLLKKKKYAAMKYLDDGQLSSETKGLDIVRRDWCPLSHDVGEHILELILTLDSREELVSKCHEFLTQVATDMRANKFGVEKYTIHKGLTKNPEDYADKQQQPHVQVALRLKSDGKMLRALDTIPFVTCLDSSSNSPSLRAYHPDEMKKRPTLTVDIEHYLKNQIHPVVSRLLEPIEGTDAAMIAESLGLDPAGYRRDFQGEGEEDAVVNRAVLSLEDRFKGVEKLSLKCKKCKMESPVAFVDRKAPSLPCCSHCQEMFSEVYLGQVLQQCIDSFVDKYYRFELRCDEQSCPYHAHPTRSQPLVYSTNRKGGLKCFVPHCSGSLKQTFTARELDLQLSYYKALFDLSSMGKLGDSEDMLLGVNGSTSAIASCASLARSVDKYLKNSAWHVVELGNIFTKLGMTSKHVSA